MSLTLAPNGGWLKEEIWYKLTCQMLALVKENHVELVWEAASFCPTIKRPTRRSNEDQVVENKAIMQATRQPLPTNTLSLLSVVASDRLIRCGASVNRSLTRGSLWKCFSSRYLLSPSTIKQLRVFYDLVRINYCIDFRLDRLRSSFKSS